MYVSAPCLGFLVVRVCVCFVCVASKKVSPSVRVRLRALELCDVELHEFASDLVCVRVCARALSCRLQRHYLPTAVHARAFFPPRRLPLKSARNGAL
jgi:hypothetical protein